MRGKFFIAFLLFSSITSAEFCNLRLMHSYFFEGKVSPDSQHFKMCPVITNNCCTTNDHIRIFQLSEEHLIPKLEDNEHKMLKLLKKLRKLHTSARKIKRRKTFAPTQRKFCNRARRRFGRFPITKFLKSFKVGIKEAFHEHLKLHQSFLCTFCDMNAHSEIIDITNTVPQDLGVCTDVMLRTQELLRAQNIMLIDFFRRLQRHLDCTLYENKFALPFMWDDRIVLRSNFRKCLNLLAEDPGNAACMSVCEHLGLGNYSPIFEGDHAFIGETINMFMFIINQISVKRKTTPFNPLKHLLRLNRENQQIKFFNIDNKRNNTKKNFNNTITRDYSRGGRPDTKFVNDLRIYHPDELDAQKYVLLDQELKIREEFAKNGNGINKSSRFRKNNSSDDDDNNNQNNQTRKKKNRRRSNGDQNQNDQNLNYQNQKFQQKKPNQHSQYPIHQTQQDQPNQNSQNPTHQTQPDQPKQNSQYPTHQTQQDKPDQNSQYPTHQTQQDQPNQNSQYPTHQTQQDKPDQNSQNPTHQTQQDQPNQNSQNSFNQTEQDQPDQKQNRRMLLKKFQENENRKLNEKAKSAKVIKAQKRLNNLSKDDDKTKNKRNLKAKKLAIKSNKKSIRAPVITLNKQKASKKVQKNKITKTQKALVKSLKTIKPKSIANEENASKILAKKLKIAEKKIQKLKSKESKRLRKKPENVAKLNPIPTTPFFVPNAQQIPMQVQMPMQMVQPMQIPLQNSYYPVNQNQFIPSYQNQIQVQPQENTPVSYDRKINNKHARVLEELMTDEEEMEYFTPPKERILQEKKNKVGISPKIMQKYMNIFESFDLTFNSTSSEIFPKILNWFDYSTVTRELIDGQGFNIHLYLETLDFDVELEELKEGEEHQGEEEKRIGPESEELDQLLKLKWHHLLEEAFTKLRESYSLKLEAEYLSNDDKKLLKLKKVYTESESFETLDFEFYHREVEKVIDNNDHETFLYANGISKNKDMIETIKMMKLREAGYEEPEKNSNEKNEKKSTHSTKTGKLV